ncbi:actin depolymerizing protein [Didymella exigua CBS 183.55]|uniref:Actin depolymerizing protein n=1 Tax=Didymella exigua CBS 183.55 TaxID=1150837 RepID=A0A6A5RN89_9PLEO|nr:actin depolymerizing protein [Didymella exigua CBS 183.55]KAF1929875.1 actin depolymerizing protein [Didymella exigua CBS 183.55]
MPPHEGLVHQQEYDWRDSNVALLNSDIDHKVKYQSATSEPAWNNGIIGTQAGLFIWRIEDFEVVPWPREKYGSFHEGDSYIVLHTEEVRGDTETHLIHDIFFWLGRATTQDEAGTAAYKTVELDEFLHGAATQHRELQTAPSDAFSALFPRLKILRGGVRSGFNHVEINEEPEHMSTLLRVFKHPSPTAGRDAVVVHEVEPTWQSLDEGDVFVLDKGDKILVWQGKKCSPMEKMKAAQVVNDLTIAKHVDVEVLSQEEARSKAVVDYLGGHELEFGTRFECARPVSAATMREVKKLFKLSDAGGDLAFDLVKEGNGIGREDLDGDDVFLLDVGKSIWIWEGSGASRAERASWLRVAQRYLGMQPDANELSIAKVKQGNEGKTFWGAVEA